MNKPQRAEGFIRDEPAAIEAPTPQAAPAQAPAPEPEPQETWPIKVRLLHRTIRDNDGNDVKELSFRQPTGGDINRYGNPVRIDQNGDVVIDERKMTLIMTALTGIMSPLLERMDPRDWNSAAYRLRNFFLPDPAAW
jgi:hypothetical protein